MNDGDSPLRDADCDCLDAVIASVAKTRQLLQKCKECQIPVDELESQNETHGKLASAIKAKFFPQRA